MENLRIDNFEQYSPDHSGEMVLDVRRHPSHLESVQIVKEPLNLNLSTNLS